MNTHPGLYKLTCLMRKEVDFPDYEETVEHLKNCPACAARLKFLKNPINAKIPLKLKPVSGGKILKHEGPENKVFIPCFSPFARKLGKPPVDDLFVAVISSIRKDAFTDLQIVDVVTMHKNHELAASGDIVIDDPKSPFNTFVINAWNARTVLVEVLQRGKYLGNLPLDVSADVVSYAYQIDKVRPESVCINPLLGEKDPASIFRNSVVKVHEPLSGELEARQEAVLKNSEDSPDDVGADDDRTPVILTLVAEFAQDSGYAMAANRNDGIRELIKNNYDGLLKKLNKSKLSKKVKLKITKLILTEAFRLTGAPTLYSRLKKI
ncbi:MAG: hypothetical protein JNL74_08380 [Fibrobacteres bacterium]|nr:hypothetical protein [Fibrobacterota bacterium]